MFESLSEKLQSAFDQLRGRGRLTERQIKDVLRELRMAMLEADVNYRVTRDFIDKVQRRALESESLKSLTPDQQTLTIVKEELTALMGETAEPLQVPENRSAHRSYDRIERSRENNRLRQTGSAPQK